MTKIVSLIYFKERWQMAKNILPYDQLTTEGSGFDMLGSAMRKAAGKSDMFDGKIEFKAVVVRGVSTQKLTNDANANVHGTDPSSAKQPIGVGNKAYRVRIMDENSTHAFLPDPCSPQVTGTANLLICDMHTLALSPDEYVYGDEVMIQLNKRDFSYNLDLAYITRKINSNAERWGGGAKRLRCSQPSTEAFKDASSLAFLGINPAGGGKPTFFPGPPRVDVAYNRLNVAAKGANLPQESLDTFFSDLLKAIGGKETTETMKFLNAWSHLEQPQTLNNPLATTWPSPGVNTWSGDPQMTIFNTWLIDKAKPDLGYKSGVKNYSKYSTGLEATKKTIMNGYYPDVLLFLQQKLKDSSGNIITNAAKAILVPSVSAQIDKWGSIGHKVVTRMGKKQTKTFISAKSLGPITSTNGVPQLPSASGGGSTPMPAT